MKGLAGLILSLFDLFEAEGRLLQENILITVQRAVIMAFGLLFGVAAVAFLVAAAFATLTMYLAVPVVLFLIAILCASICGAMIWWVKRGKVQIKKTIKEKKAAEV